MNLAGRELRRKMEGAEIGLLHEELLLLGFEIPENERARSLFGKRTEQAVMDFQRSVDRAPTGVVDEETAAALNSEVERRQPPATRLLVRGRVADASGQPLAKSAVRAFDRDLRAEELLGEAHTDGAGRYEIRYGPDQFRRAEKERADLVVRAFDADGREQAASATVFNAEPEEIVDLVVGNEIYRGPSEYEQLVAELTPLLQDLTFAELTEDGEHQDITFLSGETDQDPIRISFLIAAHRLLAETEIPAEVFYGLFREGLPTALPGLLAQSSDLQRSALERSAEANIIPPTFGKDAEEIVQRLQQLIVEEALKEPDEEESTGATLAALLGVALEDVKLRGSFLSAYSSHAGPIDEFWKEMAGRPEFETRIEDVQRTLQLGALTGNHLPLVHELERMRSDGEITELSDLTRFSEEAWLEILTKDGGNGPLGVPLDVPGEDEAEKTRNYAKAMSHLVEEGFPTAFVARRLEADDLTGGGDMVAFLDTNPDFDVRSTRLASYLEENPSALESVQDPEGTKIRLQTLQRAYRLAPRYEQASALVKGGADSAYAISRMGENVFLSSYGEALGGRAQAKRVYSKAQQVGAIAINLAVEFGLAGSKVPMSVAHDEAVLEVEGVPEWSTLFGSLELCACEHCRSVHSPAAYLTDVLHFLRDRSSRIDDKNVKDILFLRRPDLGEIELTCENTNTPLPYVDLVNEALENAVAPLPAFVPFALPAERETDLNSHTLSQDLREDFNPHLSDAAVISVGGEGTPWDVAPDWWTIDEPAFTYTIRKENDQLQVAARGLQTKGSAAERAANPQYVNASAYDMLAQAVYPLLLPFDLWAEETRAYLAHLGVPRFEIMEALQPGDRAEILGREALAREHLSLTSAQADVITGVTGSQPGASDPGPWNLWGFQNENLGPQSSIPDPSDSTRRIAAGHWLDVLAGRVDVFLRQAGLEYRELLDLLDTYYLNPLAGGARTVHVVSDPEHPDTCETDRLSLRGFDEEAARRTVRFVRLCRALGWSMRDLDRSITAFTSTDLDDVFLIRLSHVQRLHRTLGVPVAYLLGWWAELDTAFYVDHSAPGQPRAPSLYDQLFRNRATVNPPDPAFAEDPADLTGTLTEHSAAITAALSISAANFAMLLADENVVSRDAGDSGPPELTLDNLSRLFRHTSLASALQLRLSDYLIALKLITADPFASTTETMTFVEAVAKVGEAGVNFVELNYVLRHAVAPESPIAPDDEAIAIVLDELRARLQGIAEENIFRPAVDDPAGATSDPNGDRTRQKLALLNWDRALVDQAVATLNGTLTYQESLAALPVGVELPNAPAVYAVNLSTLPAGFALPVELGGVLVYDASSQRLTATRFLTVPERDLLQTAADLAGDNALTNAIAALFQEQDELFGAVSYDAQRQVLSFAGAMTERRRARLDGISNEGAYRAAVQALYDAPRRYVRRIMRTFTVHGFAAELAALPASVRIPSALKRKVYLDAAAIPTRLHCRGVMTEQERDALLALSTDTGDPNHAAYQAAVAELYAEPEALAPEASDVFLTASDADTLFAMEPGDRFLLVLEKLLPRLRLTLSEQAVVQTMAEALSMEARTADALLRTQLTSPVDSQRRCLAELLDPVFAESNANIAIAPAAFPAQFKTFVRAHKAAMVAGWLELTHPQMSWLFTHGPDAGWLDFNTTPTDAGEAAADFADWLRLAEVVRLRDELPQGEKALGGLLARAHAIALDAPAAEKDASKQGWCDALTRWTNWAPSDLEALLGPAGNHTRAGLLDAVYPDDYRGGRLLVCIRDAFSLLERVGMSAPQAADLAAGEISQADALTIRQIVRAKYDDAQWLSLAKPLRDVLREQQRAALVAYLVAHLRLPFTQQETPHPVLEFNPDGPARPAVRELQQKLNAAGVSPLPGVDGIFGDATRDAVIAFQQANGLAADGVVEDATWAALDTVRRNLRDANDLYAHFLIDVEMDPCMMTSRIKQAISSAQLFVQRCLVNLEPDVPASATVDDRWREWRWMKNYRLWEANRKIFLYAENWIEAELRDDKSPFFAELESELLQSDLTAETAEEAFLHYLEKLDHVAHPEVVAIHHQLEHDADDLSAVDILHVFARTTGTPHSYYYRQRVDSAYWTAWEQLDLDIEGEHLIPIVWNRRLYLFWPIFGEPKARPLDPIVQSGNLSRSEASMFWELKVAWSERRHGEWTSKRASSTPLIIDIPQRAPEDSYIPARFLFRAFVDAHNNLHIGPIHVGPGVSDSDGVTPGRPAEGVTWTPPPNVFRFDGCYAEPTIVFMSTWWRDFIERPTGTDFDRMFLRELNEGPLYLPAPTNTQALAKTPGTHFLLPHADGSGIASHPFFIVGNRRTFFAVPSQSLFAWSWRDESRVDPGSVLDIARHYWNSARATPSPITLLAEPRDSWLFEPSFPVTRELGRELTQPSAVPPVSPNSGGTTGLQWHKHRPKTRFQFQTFSHPYVCTFVRELNRNGMDGLLQRPMQMHPNGFSRRGPNNVLQPALDFEREYEPSKTIVREPYPVDDVDFDEGGAYASYNWELFFHAPLLVADRLSKNQRYEDAQRWFHYIFDPTDTSSLGVPQRYWRTKPFHERTREGYQRERIQHILTLVAAGANEEAKAKLNGKERAYLGRFIRSIDQWRKNPFNPHLIARMRTTAYQKTVVMKYLDNLIAWADQLFRRDTIESINEATQLYILGAEILGRRPEEVPARATPRVQSYNSLEADLDEFSNALKQMEDFVHPSSDGSAAVTVNQPAPSLPGMLYFCIPKNDKLLAYWDTISDRLFKLRHCMNIEGVVRQLALFEPAIEPGLLVRAEAAGVDVSSALSDVGAAPPYYRFSVLAQKATELCGELKALGQAMLSALEKRDAEKLSLLRAGHETTLLTLAEEIRTLQLDEAERNKRALSRSRDAAVSRYVHYQRLLGAQSPQVPDIGMRIPEGSPSSQVAIGEAGGVKTIPLEQEEMERLATANRWQVRAARAELAAQLGYLIPTAKAAFWGIGIEFGGKHIGPQASALASGLRALATSESYQGTQAGRLGSFALRAHDWLLQSNLAAREIMQIDQQYLAAELRQQIADRELTSHRRQLAHAREAEEFLQGKYTNEALYGWMIGQLATVYFQTYQLAYDVAKRAERAFRHELGLNDSGFIQFGYWDSLKKGLLAGERLSHDLKRMEVAYLDQHRREYEITKHVSLAQLDPIALLQLRQTGDCIVNLPEPLFDVDFPGHFMRRIKSVSVSIPCVTGPHTGVNCTLTLLRSSVRQSPTLLGGKKYGRQEGDPRFVDALGSIDAIVTSRAQEDSGLFEPNLRDDRFLPFEGAGAISDWQIELPTRFRQFDYDTISDVILHVRYTAREGGEMLKQQASLELQRAVNEFVRGDGQQGLAQIFSLRHEFSSDWYRFLNPPADAVGDQTLTMALTKDRFPFLLQDRSIAIETMELFVKIEPDLASSHNESTLKISLEAGAAASNNPLELALWNGLFRAVRSPAGEPGEWTLTAWLDDGGGAHTRLDPRSIQDLLLVCHYRVS